MNQKKIKKSFLNKQVGFLDTYHQSAVLIPILEIEDQLHILFEIRSPFLNSQPGEICFPGGRLDPNESSLACALRETREELNIEQENIEVIGQLDYLVTPFNMAISSFCGFIRNITPEEISFNTDEVFSIFTVPLNELMKQKPIESQLSVNIGPSNDFPYSLIQKGREYQWKSGIYPVYFYQYNHHIIWGITAKILKNFLDTIRSNEKELINQV